MIHVRKEDIVTAMSNYCTHMDTPQDLMKAEKTERRGERKKGAKRLRTNKRSRGKRSKRRFLQKNTQIKKGEHERYLVSSYRIHKENNII